jgi:hypothetical protein
MAMMDFQGPSFTMKVPTNWYITATPQIQAMFVAPPSEDGVYANLTVTLQPLEAGATLDAVMAETLSVQEKEYAEYNLREQETLELDGITKGRMVYTWMNKKHGQQVHQRQEMFIVGEMLYTLTATRSVVDSDEVKQLDALLRHMMETFTLK